MKPDGSDDSAGRGTISVIVETPRHSGLAGPLTYGVPPRDAESERTLPAGTLVRVPLGSRTTLGIVWPTGPDGPPPATVRDAIEALDMLPPLGADWLALAAFVAGYYQRSAGELALSVLPPALRQIDGATLARTLDRRARRRAKERAAPPAPATAGAPPVLAADQRAAVDAVVAALDGDAGVFLLHGATGSGKTEVYLHAAAAALARGRQVLVLVPEINLTPQLVGRFGARFAGRTIAVQHSGLGPAARLAGWLEAHLGSAELVLGTRLAVFASLPRLGLVVVDEEHDPSYKQQEGARYSARDLAVWLGQRAGVPVVLGSATPSLESWRHAEAGRYRKLALPERVGDAPLPTWRVVDLGRELPAARGAPREALSAPLVAALEARLHRGEQSLVFLNRRGYAPVLHCGECAWMSACPHCTAWRVYHRQGHQLVCHHCGAAERVPRACPECGNPDIAPVGRGTERVEEELGRRLPGARVARIDADTTRGAGRLEAALAAVHAGDVDILVGTQMVAKGHDFRRITLVAAVDADSALYSSDFRAGERLFALLMQAAGRAGRNPASGAAAAEAWLQTRVPGHPLYAALARHDYPGFAAEELEARRSVGLPPFSHLALLRAEARTVAAAQAFLDGAAEAARTLAEADGTMVYAPVPHAVARVAGVERMQMLVESASRPALQAMLRAWAPALHALARAPGAAHGPLLRFAVDVDPLAI